MEIKIMKLEGDLIRLATSGHVSSDGWAAQRDPLGDLFGQEMYSRKVLLNVAMSEFMDSTGVEWLLRCHQRFEKAGGFLVVHSPKPLMNQFLKMMRIDQVLHLARDESTAEKMCQEIKNGQP